ncbi:Protein dopey-1 [Homalodisca vitripennis]|nr:Protein dopey-1 [Homalodisca vitripennis]
MHSLLTVTILYSSHIRLLSALDWSWVVNSNNGLHANGHPHWLQLQLAAAKLLYLAVQLPADTLPQFQMYRWAFVSNQCDTPLSQPNADFIPHVTRIARLMDAKFGGPPEEIPSPLLPPGSTIRSLKDLHPFFTAMSGGKFTTMSLAELETNIELDFLEPMPASPSHVIPQDPSQWTCRWAGTRYQIFGLVAASQQQPVCILV